jgi:hypothetical protein
MIHIKLQESPGSSLIKRMSLATFLERHCSVFAEGSPESEPLSSGALLAGQFLVSSPRSEVLWATFKWPGHPSSDLLMEGYSLFSLLFLLKQIHKNKKTIRKKYIVGPSL